MTPSALRYRTRRAERSCPNCGKWTGDGSHCTDGEFACAVKCPTMHEDVLAEIERFGITPARGRAMHIAQSKMPRVSGNAIRREMPPCPKCGHAKTYSKGALVPGGRQRRACRSCGGIFTTNQRAEIRCA